MRKKFFRTLHTYLGQIISMIVMISIAIAVFAGFNLEWFSIKNALDSSFTRDNYPNYVLYSDAGFSDNDIELLKEIDEIEDLSGHLKINTGIENYNESTIQLNMITNYSINSFTLVEGVEYVDNFEGIYLNDKFMSANGLNVGDEITLTYENYELKGEIIGSVKASDYIIPLDTDQGMIIPSYDTFGYCYVSQNFLTNILPTIIYTQIDIISEYNIDSLSDLVNDKLNMTLLLTEMSDNASYQGASGEVEEGKVVAKTVPFIFLIIAFLSLVSTLDRICISERIQIGTFKALGFKNKSIIKCYTCIGFFVGIVGAIFGTILGYLLGWFIFNENGSMSIYCDFLEWKLCAPFYTWIVVIIIILLLTLVSYYFIRKTLNCEASRLLRKPEPKNFKSLLIEKSKIWDRLSFVNRWNIRDIFRHKIRTSMTLIGIIGCTLLLFMGFGLKDTVNNYLLEYKNSNDYTTMITLSNNISNDYAIEIANYYDADYSSSVAVSSNDNTYLMNVYNLDNNYIKFISDSNEYINLSDDGVYISLRISKALNLNKGDTIEVSPYGTNFIYSFNIAGVCRILGEETILMSKNYADSLNVEYNIKYLYTKETNISSNEYIDSTQTFESLYESISSMMSVLNEMIVLIVIGSVIVGIIVLYNLGIMSFIERYREIATLKVVGFKNGILTKINISQNIWLTIVGIIIGIPLSYITLLWILKELAPEYEIAIHLSSVTWIVTIILTFGVSMLVCIFMSKKNNKVSMVEALKSNE